MATINSISWMENKGKVLVFFSFSFFISFWSFCWNLATLPITHRFIRTYSTGWRSIKKCSLISCKTSPVLSVFGSQSSVQFLDDAGGGQQRVHVPQVWGACRSGYPAPQRVFGKSEVPGKGGWSRACLVCRVWTCVTWKSIMLWRKI